MEIKGNVTMFNTFKEWEQAFYEDPSLNGISPGGLATVLGVSRQYVSAEIKRGNIKVVRIKERRWGRKVVTMVPDDEVRRLLTKVNKGVQN